MKPRKYFNRKVTVDGITFDSQAEHRRWCELQLLERAGHIQRLERQLKIPLAVNGVKICTLIIDAAYFEGQKRIYEDTKSRMTRKLPVWRIKAKLLKAIYPNVELREHVG